MQIDLKASVARKNSKISGAADIFDQLAQSDDVVEAHPMPVTERTQ